jgi:hypothetical protein
MIDGMKNSDSLTSFSKLVPSQVSHKPKWQSESAQPNLLLLALNLDEGSILR